MDMQRLRTSLYWSRERLRKFRSKYSTLIEQVVTDNYTEDSVAPAKVIMNMLGMAVDIHTQLLVPDKPQVAISSDFQEYAPVAHDFEIALNKDFEQLRLKEALQEMAVDAWFSVGIIKIFMEKGNLVDVGTSEAIDIGRLAVKSVSIDNWVHDCYARKFEECTFYGDLQRHRLYEIKESPLYQNTEGLQASYPKNDYDELGETTAHELTTESNVSQESTPVDFVDLWDIFLPHEQLLVTIPMEWDGGYGSQMPLRVVEWEGPKHGPYHMVTLHDVPENIMPPSPGMQLKNLHDLINNLMRKISDQSKRQKTLGAIKPGSAEDARRIREANDGEILTLDDPSSFVEFRTGGIDAQNHGFAHALMGYFDQHAGNLQSMGGLSPSADTLGQEQILQGQISVRVQKQKQKVLDAVGKIAKDIGWYRWHDQFFEPRVVKTVPNSNPPVSVLGSFNHDDRIGHFVDYNFSIEPYSLENTPPQAKVQSITGIIHQVIIPLSQQMAEQGIALNIEALLKILARYSNVPELNDIVTYMNGEQMEGPKPVSAQSVTRPPVTRHENVRYNRPSATQQGKNEILVRSLLGAPTQQSERNHLLSPTG